MASNQPNFPTRPYSTGFNRPSASDPQATRQPQPFTTTPAAAPFGASTSHQHREAARLEKERLAAQQAAQQQSQNALAEISEDQREEISEAFQLFDLDKDGWIDYHELKVAMKALGFDCSKQEITQILRDHGQSVGGLQGQQQGKKPQQGQQQQQTFLGPGKLMLSLASFQNLVCLPSYTSSL